MVKHWVKDYNINRLLFLGVTQDFGVALFCDTFELGFYTGVSSEWLFLPLQTVRRGLVH